MSSESWSPSAAARSAVVGIPRHYDSPPPWADGANCTGGMLPGTRQLADIIRAKFPTIVDHTEGYNCRQNTADSASTSMHGTGRAIDVMMKVRGDVSREGDLVANWLMMHARELDIQEIIWSKTIWSSSRGVYAYTGPVSHYDHIHLALGNASARALPALTADVSTPPPQNASLLPVVLILGALVGVYYLTQEGD